MQSSINEQQFGSLTATALDVGDAATVSLESDRLFWFRSQFTGVMEMYADADTVANYLDAHQGWFRRCAAPMQVNALGRNGYALTIGRFGALGYHVEPKIGLELVPQHDRIYDIETIPIPDYTAPGYEVEFKARQILSSVPRDPQNPHDREITRVEWQLDLAVGVGFPKFILALSPALIQKTGDRLIAEIVKQVSRRLTHKVQEDFHATLGQDALKTYRKLRKVRTSFYCTPVVEAAAS
ncbi:hypothetical protein AY599_12765 [Leptolyngbya valderiana BDU 20041]|uniref:DUF1997 domain-containing protein n=1 Tax=Baaleninema simplex TaxID=2862350 RepID=UPI00034DE903|nr:DUF1997 domain-containing protein [Baaleninema simplex]MDC0835796.1 DUF1997 domain-containing protein [Geitlerinema sp. CS-897]OAB61337.1 hypothetical protein AY599_12765 [Leptolyngbya valderiana BDU 20041]PPT08824.1 hypothetical protein CKA32_002217 [Geitlerinema sp. FC II]